MAVAQREIDAFHQFATEELRRGAKYRSIDDLYEHWRLTNPSAEEALVNLRAVRAALRDMDNGDVGRDIEDVMRDFRQRSKP
jgi:hypothetical protein